MRTSSSMPSPSKDVDGFHPSNSGAFWQQRRGRPVHALGVIHLLDDYGIDVQGKNALVIGRSNIVGRPMAELLLQRNATVTIAHSRTADLERQIGDADIVVAAIGRPGFVMAQRRSSRGPYASTSASTAHPRGWSAILSGTVSIRSPLRRPSCLVVCGP